MRNQENITYSATDLHLALNLFGRMVDTAIHADIEDEKENKITRESAG